MDGNEQIFSYWNYFISIEEDLLKFSRYVEFDNSRSNFGVYSIELCRLLMASCAGVETAALAALRGRARKANIGAINRGIHEKFPELAQSKVFMHRFGLELLPWQHLASGESAVWWGAYNDVKHGRVTNFQSATLENALNAAAALFLILIHLCISERISGLNPSPRAFSTELHISCETAYTGGGIGFHIWMPDEDCS